MARLRYSGILNVFSEVLYSSWRGWARLLLHCLRSIDGNSSEPPEEFFCEIVFVASMSSLIILMSDCVFDSGCLYTQNHINKIILFNTGLACQFIKFILALSETPHIPRICKHSDIYLGGNFYRKGPYSLSALNNFLHKEKKR